jgi:hypothetical protein
LSPERFGDKKRKKKKLEREGSLTGNLVIAGLLTPFPKFSSWNWIICEMSWASDLAVGGSLWTC